HCTSEPRLLRADTASVEERRARVADCADAAVGAGKELSCLWQLEALHLLDVAQSRLREGHAEAALGRDCQIGSPVAVEISGREPVVVLEDLATFSGAHVDRRAEGAGPVV